MAARGGAVAALQCGRPLSLFCTDVEFWSAYRLKHFIDVVTLPGQNWSWSPATGYQALLSGKKAALIYASAGAYAAHTEGASESPDDFQKPYLRRWLRFLGIEDVAEISAAPTLTTPDVLAAAKADAKARATALALPSEAHACHGVDRASKCIYHGYTLHSPPCPPAAASPSPCISSPCLPARRGRCRRR